MMDTALLIRVITALKKSDQTLVFLDSKICPVRSLVGRSRGDGDMHCIAKHLKKKLVIEDYTGFMSLAENPPFVYITSFSLTDQFFNDYCREGEQLTLFK